VKTNVVVLRFDIIDLRDREDVHVGAVSNRDAFQARSRLASRGGEIGRR
jgi:hypothetical protein